MTAIQELEEFIVRFNQSRRCGKLIISIENMEAILKVVVRALKEK